MRKYCAIFVWLAFTLILYGTSLAIAQEADDFSMPSESNASIDSGSTPANPAEAPISDSSLSEETTSTSAQANDSSSSEANLEEPERVEVLAGKYKFSPANENKDPFKPLVVKKVVLPPAPPPVVKPTGPAAPPPPPPPKPIQLFVSGICGNDNERLAMITFENKQYVVSKDMVVDGKFKVVDILPDRIVIYSNKEQMRRTFPLGGGKD